MKKDIEIAVDHREIEGKPELLDMIPNHPEVSDYVIEDLDLGDFQVKDSGVVVERKTIDDFVASMSDGRLREQPPRLAESCDHPYILVEGDYKQFGNKSVRMDENSIRGMIASVCIRHGVPVMCVSNTEGLLDQTVKFGRKAIEDPSGGYIDTGAGKKTAPTVLRMYSCLPGIGPARAEALYEKYPEVSYLIDANVQDISEIEGIGKKTAANIKLQVV